MSIAPSEATRIEGTLLDHIAHAVPRWQDVWHRYATDLGAEWSSGGPGPGFAPGQLRFANGARVEMLMPWNVDVNDFLSRFLAANGPGPHHLTFKVPDLAEAIERVRTFGIEPVGIDFDHPEWLEAFLHPKLATGIVVQLAEEHETWSDPAPDDFPMLRRQQADHSGPVPPASLLRVCHVVADIDGALDLFGGVLNGRVVQEGTSAGLRWVDLTWPGPLGIRLMATAVDASEDSVAAWLGGRPGRVHHITLEVDEPEGVPGSSTATSVFALAEADTGSSVWEIDRDANAGLGVVLVPPGTPHRATPNGPVT
jgi:catechol 2,3-dioxygenase-like lactoylglutathione lyase family enzyme